MTQENILHGDEVTTTLKCKSLGEFFFDFAKQNQEKINQIDANSDQQETYGDVLTRSIKLALGLQKLGITSKDVVLCCSHNSMDNLIPILSSFYVATKVASMDPTLSPRQIKHLVSITTPRLIFADEICVENIEQSLNEAGLKSEIVVLGNSSKYDTMANLIQSQKEDEVLGFRPVEVDQHQIALMFFSSGTTGVPKAICHSHYSFLNQIIVCPPFESHAIMHFTTFYWISAMLIVAQCYLVGGTRIFAKEVTGELVFKSIEKYKLTSVFMAPIYTYHLTNFESPEKYNTSSLIAVLTGGTKMNTSQIQNLHSLFPNMTVIFGYGMSEVGVLGMFNRKKDLHLMKEKLGSCGKVIEGSKMKIVDTDTGNIAGPNQRGEICFKNAGLMLGYYNVDSSKEFDADGYLKTGDIGYYDDDKCVYVVDRVKEIFKYRSWHIVPSTIEAVLCEHPAVNEAVVFGIPKDEEGEMPAACIVLKDGQSANEDEILNFVAQRVSDREKLRGGITFRSELPRTGTGKLQRNAIRNIILKSNLNIYT